METYNVVLTFESVHKILWCDHVNAPLRHYFYTEPFDFHLGFFLNFDFVLSWVFKS